LSEFGNRHDITALMARRLRCSGCLRRFRTQDIITLESAPRRGVFRLDCPMCHTNRLIIGVWNKNAMCTYVTDLDEEEWNHYRHTAPIAVDDLLRVVQMLKTYEGDFTDVLEDPIFDEED
jgi:hypothetical protein